MSISRPMKHVDVAIVGCGPAGVVLAGLNDSVWRGRVRSTTNVAPCPGALLTPMRPPMASMKALVMVNPSPVPP